MLENPQHQHQYTPFEAPSLLARLNATSHVQVNYQMIKAIGVDLVKVSRISRILQSSRKDRFLSRVLHSSEHATYLTIEASKKAVEFVAGSWAAKEAVFKTLDKEDQLQFSFNEWYRYKVDDKPQIAKDPPLINNSFLLSVSHDGDHLIATALRLETK